MGRKSKVKVIERDPNKFYTKNIYLVAWFKVYNIYPERILIDLDKKPLFEYEKSPRIKELIGKLKDNVLMQKFLFCLKETLFEVNKAQKSKEVDRQ